MKCVGTVDAQAGVFFFNSGGTVAAFPVVLQKPSGYAMTPALVRGAGPASLAALDFVARETRARARLPAFAHGRSSQTWVRKLGLSSLALWSSDGNVFLGRVHFFRPHPSLSFFSLRSAYVVLGFKGWHECKIQAPRVCHVTGLDAVSFLNT